LPTALAKNGLVAGAGGVTGAAAMKTFAAKWKKSGSSSNSFLIVVVRAKGYRSVRAKGE
jgi:hypothetical protein